MKDFLTTNPTLLAFAANAMTLLQQEGEYALFRSDQEAYLKLAFAKSCTAAAPGSQSQATPAAHHAAKPKR